VVFLDHLVEQPSRLDEKQLHEAMPHAMLLALTFFALYAAIESLAWQEPMRPGATLAVVSCGAVASWKTFARLGACFLAHIGQWKAPKGSWPIEF
jgi:hypothetical protein